MNYLNTASYVAIKDGWVVPPETPGAKPYIHVRGVECYAMLYDGDKFRHYHVDDHKEANGKITHHVFISGEVILAHAQDLKDEIADWVGLPDEEKYLFVRRTPAAPA